MAVDLDKVRHQTGFKKSAPVLMVTLPALVYYLWICVTFYGGALQAPTTQRQLEELAGHLPGPTGGALATFALWYGLQVALQMYAPGRRALGAPLGDGSRLEYRLNGWWSFWLTIVIAGALVAGGVVPATLLADQFGPLLTITNVFAFAFSLVLYRFGRGGSEVVYDYFMGTALNPRLGRFDLKLFFEARPGLVLWVLLDLSFAAQQYHRHGVVTTAMVLVCAFHFLYVADYFLHEERILGTMDIKHENFGWMLCWGDTVWVPYTYTVQAMYLVDHIHDLPRWLTVGIVAMNLAGYRVFRGANNQKDDFRANPERPVWNEKPEFIRTERGTLLLTSGWWGLARHANYMGDLTMALAWCLPCLFDHSIPYFYFTYMTWLLVHRQWRDDKMCEAKYGADWERYRRRVKWRIVPGIY